MPYYLTPKQDDYNKIPEIQICIAEALYDVDSIVADPGAYTKEELAPGRLRLLCIALCRRMMGVRTVVPKQGFI